MADHSLADDPSDALAAEATMVAGHRRGGRLRRFLRRNVTPRLATAIALWRVETRFLLPGGLVLVAVFGRWPAALMAGAIGALLAATFVWLLDGERILGEVRAWGEDNRWVRKFLLPIADRRDRTGTVLRVLSLPVLVLWFGPFWRSLSLLLFHLRGLKAYVFTVLASIPHALLWVGIVAGSLWEELIWPLIKGHV
jgi:hypothetical protein